MIGKFPLGTKSSGVAVNSQSFTTALLPSGILEANVYLKPAPAGSLGVTVTCDGQPMNLAIGHGNVSGVNGYLMKFWLVVGGGTHSIVVTKSGTPAAMEIQMVAITGLANCTLDQAAFCDGSALAPPPCGPTGMTSDAFEAATCVFMLEGSGTPTWQSTPSGIVSGGQDITDTIIGQDLVMTEGRLVLSSTTTFTASIIGFAGSGGALGLAATYS